MASQNTELVHRWFNEIWTKGNLDAVDELLEAQASIHGLGEPERGPESHRAFKAFVTRFRSAMSDIKVVVDQTVEEGDTVASRWTATMRHTGAALGIAPTNKSIKVTGMSFGKFRNGRMVEGWNNWDQAGLFSQINAPPGSVKLLPD
jgi:steroid delta-isomerase-like uncharacterized protein